MQLFNAKFRLLLYFNSFMVVWLAILIHIGIKLGKHVLVDITKKYLTQQKAGIRILLLHYY